MDERRHNMDGALFVDDDRSPRNDRDDDRRPQARPSAPPRILNDDGKAEDARRITQGILDRMDLEASVHVREDDEQVVLDIDGPDAGRAIGKKGMTLEALQFLVNKIVNREPDERRHIVLDSGDYRERHDNGLVSMAKREAKRAISSGRPVTLEPMSARDRRVIHVSLAKFPGISTRSEGEGMDRRLQIIPARGERGGRDDRDDRPRGRERDDRPRDDRPVARDARDDRPVARDSRDERPARDSRDERPARDARDERPAARDERPARDSRDERPARDSRDERPAARDERPARDSRDERPAARDERPARDSRDSRDERPAARDERPARDSRDERPAARDERPARDDRPAPRDDRAGLVERARDDRARSTRDERPRARSGGDRPSADRPAREPARTDDRPAREPARADDRPRGDAPARDYDDRNRGR